MLTLVNNRLNYILVVLFIFISLTVVFVGNKYKVDKIKEANLGQQNTIANLISNEVSILIQEKQNATLAIALSIVQSHKIKNILVKNTQNPQFLKLFSLKLRNETDIQECLDASGQCKRH